MIILFGICQQDYKFDDFNGIAVFFIGVFIFVFSLQRDLRSFCVFVFLGFFCFVFVILFEFPFFYSHLKMEGFDDFNLIHTSWEEFFSNFGIIIFSFNFFQNFHRVKKEIFLKKRNYLLKKYIIFLSLIGIFFLIIGIAEYLSIANQAFSYDVFPFRYSIWKNDYFMLFGKIFLIFFYIICGVLNTYPLKLFISSFFKKNIEKIIFCKIF